MTASRVVDLCVQNAALIREELEQMEAGTLTFHASGVDVTSDQIVRHKAKLSRLQEIIDGCGCDCG